MTITERLAELLEQWEAASTSEPNLTPEELCRHCPELAPHFREVLAGLGLARLKASDASTTPGTPSETASEAEPVPAAGGRFQAIRFHARGGLGAVFLAQDLELRREVALKCMRRVTLDPQARDRFLLEAEITGRLEHPGVVPVYGLGVDPEGQPYYAMRFIHGRAMSDAIRAYHDVLGTDPSERNVELRRLLRHFVAACETVAYAHSHGVVHRDLKPANIMIGQYGETLIVDWGLAKVLGTADGATVQTGDVLNTEIEMTVQGLAKGSPAYMSPEQARGEWDRVGPASDIFSLGATLYILLVGRTLYPSRGVRETIELAARGKYVLPRVANPNVPRPLDAVCRKAMTFEPDGRYASAKDLAADLERWLADEPVTAFRDPATVRLRRWGRKHRPLVAGLGALAVATVVGLVLGLFFVNLERRNTQSALDQVRIEQQKTATALEKESNALARSQESDQSAREQRQLALETVRVVYDEVNDEIKKRPDLQPLRKAVLGAILDRSKKIARSADTNAQVDHSQFQIHTDLGGLLMSTQGEGLALAHEQMDRALAIAEQLVRDHPEDWRHHRALLVGLINVGMVHKEEGRPTQAVEYILRAVDVGRGLRGGAMFTPQVRADWARALTRLGMAYFQVGQSTKGVETTGEAVQVARELYLDDQGDEVTRLYGVTLSNYAEAALLIKENDKAKKILKDVVALREALLNTGKVETEAALALARRNLAQVHIQLNEWDQAMVLLEAARKVNQASVDTDPRNADGWRSLSVTLARIAEVHLGTQATAKAAEVSRLAVDANERWVDGDPNNLAAQRELTAALDRQAVADLRAGNEQSARDAWLKICSICTRMRQADPGNAYAARNHAIALSKLGDLARKQGKTVDAIAYHKEAIEIREKLRQADDNNPQTSRGLSTSYKFLGDVYKQNGDTAMALQNYEKSRALRQAQFEKYPSDAQAARDYLTVLVALGNAHTSVHEYGPAGKWYAAALDLTRKAPHSDAKGEVAGQLVGFVDRCDKRVRIMADLATADRLPVAEAVELLADVIRAHALAKESDKIVAAGDKVLRLVPTDAGGLYQAGCAYALGSAISGDTGQKEQWAVRSVDLFKQAIAKGLKQTDRLHTSGELKELRERKDFQRVLADVPK